MSWHLVEVYPYTGSRANAKFNVLLSLYVKFSNFQIFSVIVVANCTGSRISKC